jgi:hypothetical protein
MTASLRRWTKVGGSGDGSFVKWDKDGQSLEGKWRGTKVGQYGDLGMMELTDGKHVTFPIHTALADPVKRFREGAEVQIVYTGKVMGKNGREFKAFDCFVANPDDLIERDADGDVPF